MSIMLDMVVEAEPRSLFAKYYLRRNLLLVLNMLLC